MVAVLVLLGYSLGGPGSAESAPGGGVGARRAHVRAAVRPRSRCASPAIGAGRGPGRRQRPVAGAWEAAVRRVKPIETGAGRRRRSAKPRQIASGNPLRRGSPARNLRRNVKNSLRACTCVVRGLLCRQRDHMQTKYRPVRVCWSSPARASPPRSGCRQGGHAGQKRPGTFAASEHRTMMRPFDDTELAGAGHEER